jgi:hypothetical protein
MHEFRGCFPVSIVLSLIVLSFSIFNFSIFNEGALTVKEITVKEILPPFSIVKGHFLKRSLSLACLLTMLASTLPVENVAWSATTKPVVRKTTSTSSRTSVPRSTSSQNSSYTSQPVNTAYSDPYAQQPYPQNAYPQQAGYPPQYPQAAYGQQPSYGSQQYGQPNYGQPSYGQQLAPLQGYVVSAPVGTRLNATLSTTLSSQYARVGDRFTASLGGDVAAGGSVVLPSGSQLEGQVMAVNPAGRAGRPGELDVRFTSATLPNGQRVPISAKIQTEDGTGLIRGGTTAGRFGRAAMNAGLGAGLGAALGTAMGPLSGGGVGRGAIYGTALGGGLGALSSGVQKGKEAEIPGGQSLQVVLDQPLTVSPQQNYNNNYNYASPGAAPGAAPGQAPVNPYQY